MATFNTSVKLPHFICGSGVRDKIIKDYRLGVGDAQEKKYQTLEIFVWFVNMHLTSTVHKHL